MPAQPTLGPLVDSYDIEAAVLTTLRERLPTHVDAVAHIRGLDPAEVGLPIRPRTLCRRKAFSGFPKTSLPLVEVTSPGQAQPSIRSADGLYLTFWQIEVFSVVAARDYESTRLLRAIWEPAIYRCIMQSQTLGGLAMAVDWLGQGSDDVDLPDDSERTLQGAVSVFMVSVPGCLDPFAGPVEFIPDDGSGVPGEYDPAVTADTVSIELEILP